MTFFLAEQLVAVPSSQSSSICGCIMLMSVTSGVIAPPSSETEVQSSSHPWGSQGWGIRLGC